MHFSSDSNQRLYIQVYEYYKKQILDGRLPAGSRLPSLRKCTSELSISRTTAEAAYLQLAADGYVIAKPQSGYFVTYSPRQSTNLPSIKASAESISAVSYDFSSNRVDRDSFSIQTWRRYLKSALRQKDRLLSYGEPQGESDLRLAICEYVREKRNIICSPDDILIGSGFQSLLQIICPLLRQTRQTVSFPSKDFQPGIQIFKDHSFEIHIKDKNADIIYVTPAQMTKWGSIMPVSRRIEMLEHCKQTSGIIIEDDFENDFVYLQKPTPSLYSLAGGQNVLYLGSFSKLLLPSIRISFLIMDQKLSTEYRSRKDFYNQTASKAEQIALCQYIRDGHLSTQTRRLRKLYNKRQKVLVDTIQEVFSDQCEIIAGESGTSVLLKFTESVDPRNFQLYCLRNGFSFSITAPEQNHLNMVLSCSSVPEQDFLPAMELLKKLLVSFVIDHVQ